MFSWLKHTGEFYGKNIEVVFSTGERYQVPDGSVSHWGNSDNTNNHHFVWFCGTDWEPGESEYNNGVASVFLPGTANSATIRYKGTQ